MDREIAPSCAIFGDGMAFFDEERLSGLSGSCLTNDIPRYLKLSNWEDDQDDSPKYAAQAFRLVDRTLQQSLPIWHAILCGGPVPCSPSPPRGNKNTWVQFREPRKSLNAQEINDTECKLEEMLEMTTFYVLADIPGNPGGRTSPRADRKMTKLPGLGCSIGIRSFYFEQLGLKEVKENPLRSLYYNFIVASNILHELAHAAVLAAVPEDMRATTGSGGNGHLGFSSHCSEIGFEMESRLWGGIMSTRTIKREDLKREHVCYSTSENHAFGSAIVLRDWPDAPMVDRYGPNKVSVRRKVKPVRNIWRVSFHWLQKLFRDDFWQSLDTGSDQDSLQMPKMLGIPEHGIRDWSTDKQALKVAAKAILPAGYMWTAALTIKPRTHDGDLTESLRNASRVEKALLEHRFVSSE